MPQEHLDLCKNRPKDLYFKKPPALFFSKWFCLYPEFCSPRTNARKVKAIYLSGLLCLLWITPARAAQLAWPCFTGGSPCRTNCFARGGLLPHLFTLTLAGGLFSAALSVKQVYGPASPVFQPARCPMKFGSSSANKVYSGFLAIIYFSIFREHNYYIKPNREQYPAIIFEKILIF